MYNAYVICILCVYIYTHIHTYITLHYITLHYITLHYITLHYITLHTYICIMVSAIPARIQKIHVSLPSSRCWWGRGRAAAYLILKGSPLF